MLKIRDVSGYLYFLLHVNEKVAYDNLQIARHLCKKREPRVEQRNFIFTFAVSPTQVEFARYDAKKKINRGLLAMYISRRVKITGAPGAWILSCVFSAAFALSTRVNRCK